MTETGIVFGWGRNAGAELCLGYKSKSFLIPTRGRLRNLLEVTGGGEFTLGLLSDGTVRSWGKQGESGQLGDGTFETRAIPVNPGLTNIVQISAHGNQSKALSSTGQVYSWGANSTGQVGNGISEEWNRGPEFRGREKEFAQKTPYAIPSLTTATSIVTGPGTAGAVLANGHVMMWGENLSGQIGDGTKTERPSPTEVPGITTAKQLAIGGLVNEEKTHVLCLLQNGTLMAWGIGGHGELGNGKTGPTAKSLTPIVIPGLTEIIDIAAGPFCSFALKANGDLYAFGSNIKGRLGTGTSEVNVLTPTVILKKVSFVAASDTQEGLGFAFAIVEKELYGWGNNHFGEIGDGTHEVTKFEPTKIPGLKEVINVGLGDNSGFAVDRALSPALNILDEGIMGEMILDSAESYPVITTPEEFGVEPGIPMTPYVVEATEGPTKWTMEGAPTGLTISNAGVISGTPTGATAPNVVLMATNSYGSGTMLLKIFVGELPPPPEEEEAPVLIAISNQVSEEGVSIVPFTLSHTGGEIKSYEISGQPAGIKINTVTGEVFGTPTTVQIKTTKITAIGFGESSTTFKWEVRSSVSREEKEAEEKAEREAKEKTEKEAKEAREKEEAEREVTEKALVEKERKEREEKEAEEKVEKETKEEKEEHEKEEKEIIEKREKREKEEIEERESIVIGGPPLKVSLPSPLTLQYSGVVINQNQRSESTDFLSSGGDWCFQEFFLPNNYPCGVSNERRFPSLSGFQLLTKIPSGKAKSAALNWRIEYDVIGVGWTLLEQGTVMGSHTDGEKVWMDVFFPNPVETSETLFGSAFRIAFQIQQDIDSVWYAKPNPLPNSEAYREEGGLNIAFNFRLLALIADNGIDFLGNPYRSVVVDEAVEDSLTKSNTAWQSTPQPSKFAVVSNYYDVRTAPSFGLLNLLTNPSFEYGLQSWQSQSFFTSSTTFSTLKIAPGNAASGNSALLVETTGRSDQGVATIFPANEIFVQEHSYTGSVYLRSNSNKAEGIVLTLGMGTDFAEVSNITLSNTWQRFSVTWKPKASHVSDGTTGTNGVSFSIRTTTPLLDFFIDAAQVTATASEVPYIDGDIPGHQWTGAPGRSTSVEVGQSLTVIDSVLLDPQTPNVAFSVYYSNDGEADEHTSIEEWEKKLWARVPQTYIATHRQQYVFPQPIRASFIKIEYSDLQAQSYNVGDFAKPVTYKKFPIWVADFFLAQMQLPSFVANTIGISYDALEFAYNYFLDDIKQKPAEPLASPASSIGALSEFFNKTDAAALVDPATLTQINLVMNTYLAPPASLGDRSTLLGAKQSNSVLSQSNYPTEGTPEQVTQGLGNVSRLNRENIVFEQSMPIMFFFLTCRHGYKELSAAFADNKAYFAGVNELVFLRNDYTTTNDGDLYIESGGDTVNIERNDFVIHDNGSWTSY